jgi:Histidine kinase-, DNA gyrase B-, and HSP90-like ATPase
VKSFYEQDPAVDRATPETAASYTVTTAGARAGTSALVAVYDALTAPPRVERLDSTSAGDLIESLSARVYHLSREAGGQVPFMVIREIVENFIHAGFDEVVVSVLDGGHTLRFADQGPGIRDKDRVFLPGFTTATYDMKRVIKGVGSGLPVARECLSFSGGTIEIDDNLGSGTVVTLRMSVPSPPAAVEAEVVRDSYEPPTLSLRQKQVLSLAMELGSLGPTVVARELGVGLSTAYRDLEHLTHHGLITSDESGKRVLTEQGVRCLDALLGR